MKTRFDHVERSEHDGDIGGLLNERREDASVQIPDSLLEELTDGRLGGETVQLLTENHFVERKSNANVYEARCPS